ncbi:TAXI family TRAP transporter solute-binding subunit [soil metagenome]
MTPKVDRVFNRRTAFRCAGVLGAALATSACQGRPEVELRLAAGESGGFFWEFAGLLAACADRAGSARITPLQSEGSVDNLEALRTGRAELALSLIDAAYDSPDRDNLTAVGCVYENYFQVAVRGDSPITSTDDLRGRLVSTGATGSGATSLSARVLAAAGLDQPGEIREVELSMRDAAQELAAGTLDAVMWAGGLPTPAFADSGVDIRLLDLTAVVARLRELFGTAYEAVPVPADVYGRHPEVTTVGVANLLLVRRDVADAAVAGIVDVLIDNSSELVPAQAVGSQFLDAQSLILTGSIPLHPGAAAEYRRRHG